MNKSNGLDEILCEPEFEFLIATVTECAAEPNDGGLSDLDVAGSFGDGHVHDFFRVAENIVSDHSFRGLKHLDSALNSQQTPCLGGRNVLCFRHELIACGLVFITNG